MSSLRVLWVDDDPKENYSSWIKRIEKCGHTLTWADSINDGIRKMKESEFDCLILDQMMPFENVAGNTRGGTEWAGCFFLHWVSGNSERWDEVCSRLSGIDWNHLSKDLQDAKPVSQPIKVIVSSAIDNRDIKNEIENVQPKVSFLPKPPNRKVLIQEIEDIDN